MEIVHTLALTLLTIISLAATVALVLSYRVDHKYSGVLFNLTIVGCIHSVFSVLYVYKQYISNIDKEFYNISLNRNFYALSFICFSTSVVIVFGYVTLNRRLEKICYGLFCFISLCLIIGIEKILGRCIENNHDTLEVKTPFRIIEHSDLIAKRVNKVVYCYYDLIDPVTASICLEYALIYVPASLLFYMTARQPSTFHEWFSKTCIEKCTRCQLNVSLCYHLAISFLVVIWCLRPMYFLNVKFRGLFADYPSEQCDIVQIVSLPSMFLIVLFHVIKVYGFRKERSKTECTTNNKQNYVLL